MESENVVYVGSTKAINALCIVANHTDALFVLCQLPHDRVLRIVGVLVLVHEDKVKMLLILGQDFRMLVEEQIGVHEDIVEVQRVSLPTARPIAFVDFARLRNLAGLVGSDNLRIVHVLSRQNEPVLSRGDMSQHGTWLIDFVVQLHIVDDALHQALAVSCIVDGIVRREADGIVLGAQDARKDAVEGAHPQTLCLLCTHLQCDAGLHLFCSFVGESQGHNLPRFHAHTEQMSNLMSEHTRLAGTGAGNHQRRTVAIFHGCLLCWIQFILIH